MVFRFTSTYVLGAYQHWLFGSEYRSWWDVFYTTFSKMCVRDLRQVGVFSFVKFCNSYNNFRIDNNRSNRYIYVCMFNKQRCMLSILFDQILNCVWIFIIVWQNILIYRRSCKCFVCNKLRKPFFFHLKKIILLSTLYIQTTGKIV
jgi:hypothetical protein